MSQELSAADKRDLRIASRALPVLVQVGKEGLTEALINRIKQLLSQRELVKVRALDTAPQDRDELVELLSAATDSAIVSAIGRTIVLYRPLPEPPVEIEAELPKPKARATQPGQRNQGPGKRNQGPRRKPRPPERRDRRRRSQ